MTTDQDRGPEFDRLYQVAFTAAKNPAAPSLTSMVRQMFDAGVRAAARIPADHEIVTKHAADLTFTDVGLHLRWTVPDPGALIEQQTPWRELAWVGFDGYGVQIGLYPQTSDEDDQFEEFYLDAATPIETTVINEEAHTA